MIFLLGVFPGTLFGISYHPYRLYLAILCVFCFPTYLDSGFILASLSFGYFLGYLFRVIGLTGGIACGKSTVVQYIKEIDIEIKVIDCDVLAREVLQTGTRTYKSIVEAFGNSVLLPNGELNREILSSLIFQDSKKRATLDRITHPAIFWKLFKQLLSYKLQGYAHVLLDAPLLFESKFLTYFCSRIVVVHIADPELWVARLCKRDSLDQHIAQLKIESQFPISLKIAWADYVLDNSSDRVALQSQIKGLLATVKSPK